MSGNYDVAKKIMDKSNTYTEVGLLKGVIAASLAVADELRIQRGAEAPEPLNVWNIFLLTRTLPGVDAPEIMRAFESAEKADKEAETLNIIADKQGLGVQWGVSSVPLTRG
jgi:hypothetical protein